MLRVKVLPCKLIRVFSLFLVAPRTLKIYRLHPWSHSDYPTRLMGQLPGMCICKKINNFFCYCFCLGVQAVLGSAQGLHLILHYGSFLLGSSDPYGLPRDLTWVCHMQGKCTRCTIAPAPPQKFLNSETRRMIEENKERRACG